MIDSFAHKRLKRLFEDDDGRRLPADMLVRIRDILFLLDSARSIDDMDRPTLRLHPLKGDLKGYWAVTVRANWRIVFKFEDGKASDVDFVDYH